MPHDSPANLSDATGQPSYCLAAQAPICSCWQVPPNSTSLSLAHLVLDHMCMRPPNNIVYDFEISTSLLELWNKLRFRDIMQFDRRIHCKKTFPQGFIRDRRDVPLAGRPHDEQSGAAISSESGGISHHHPQAKPQSDPWQLEDPVGLAGV